ncbi:MAG: hypothetical protein JXB08_01680 [Bacilli bacterium]|nr:hypothetical protein [Bacilli bacterium]MBN2877685.1 hypothetical protein [Bacilli bacterium]
MKKIMSIALIALFALLMYDLNTVRAADDGEYGEPINDYTIVDQIAGTPVNNRILGNGTIVTKYYTYYAYDELGIKFLGLANNRFTTNPVVTGAFEQVYVWSTEYTMSNSIGYSVIDGASVSLRLEYTETETYTLFIGDSATFITSTNRYSHNVGYFSINIRLRERVCTVTDSYVFYAKTGTDVDVSYTTRDFSVDIEMAPVYENSFLSLYYDMCTYNPVTDTVTYTYYASRIYKGDYMSYLPPSIKGYYFTI